MSSYDFVHWSGKSRLDNIEQDINTLKGTSTFLSKFSGTTVVVPATVFGAKFDNTTDDSAAINAAISAASLAGYNFAGNDKVACVVQLPPGYAYIASPILMQPNVVLRGQGPANTVLRINNSVLNNSGNGDNPLTTTTAVIKLATGTETQCEVRDLCINVQGGNFGSAVDGINFTQNGGINGLGDTRHVIENVIVIQSRYGLILNGSTECRVDNCGFYRQSAGTYGMAFVAGTDHMLSRITCAASNGPGFRANTSNTRFMNIKVYGGGNGTASSHGFYVTGLRNMFSEIEVQDFHGNGCYMSSQDSVWNGVMVDSCSGTGIICDAPLTKAVGTRVLNRGGAYSLTQVFDIADGMHADVQVQVGGSGGAGVPARLMKSGQTGSGNSFKFNLEDGTVSAAYAATYTPDPLVAGTHLLGALTGAITIANPATTYITSSAGAFHVGMGLSFKLAQDATGGRTVTWDTGYKVASAVDTTASSTTLISFVYDGTNWRESGRTVT